MGKSNGGSAFPKIWHPDRDGTGGDTWEDGMTVRQYYAGQAMIGLIMKWTIDKKFEVGDPEEVAKMSNWFADAMIKAEIKDANNLS